MSETPTPPDPSDAESHGDPVAPEAQPGAAEDQDSEADVDEERASGFEPPA